jgi:hypothetical protein
MAHFDNFIHRDFALAWGLRGMDTTPQELQGCTGASASMNVINRRREFVNPFGKAKGRSKKATGSSKLKVQGSKSTVRS